MHFDSLSLLKVESTLCFQRKRSTLASCALNPRALISSPIQTKYVQKPRELRLEQARIKPFNDSLAKPCYTRANLHPSNQPLTSIRHFQRGLRERAVYLHFFECTEWIVGELFNDRKYCKKVCQLLTNPKCFKSTNEYLSIIFDNLLENSL